jgi:HK97 family phage major capsid protein
MPTQVQDKLDEAKGLFIKAKEIITNPDAVTEEKNQVEAILDEARKLKAEAGQLKEIEEVAAELNQVKAKAEDQAKKDKAIGERKDKREFKDWSEFLTAAHNAANPNYKGTDDPRLVWFKDERKSGHEDKQMVESVGASGGFLVPTEFQASLQAVQGEQSIVRGRATIIRMRRRAIQLPVLDQTGTTSGIPHWFGGMQFYWEEEAAEKTITTARRQRHLTGRLLKRPDGYGRRYFLDGGLCLFPGHRSGPAFRRHQCWGDHR